jgi:hypothetical protein
MKARRLLSSIVALEIDKLRKRVEPEPAGSFVGVGTILDEFGDAFVDLDIVGSKLSGRQFCGGLGLAGALQSDEHNDKAASPLCAASTSCSKVSAACSRFSSRLEGRVSYTVLVPSQT